nr:unnamed protein product [Spirometra erinaceieuropaei]
MKNCFDRRKPEKSEAKETLEQVQHEKKEISTVCPPCPYVPATATILDSLQKIRKRVNSLPSTDRLLLGALEVVNASLQDRRKKFSPSLSPETACIPGLLFTLKEIRSALKCLKRREAKCQRKCKNLEKEKKKKKQECAKRKKRRRKECPCQRRPCKPNDKTQRQKKCKACEEEEKDCSSEKNSDCGEACRSLIHFLESLEKTAEALDWLEEEGEKEKDLCDVLPQSDPMECAPYWFPPEYLVSPSPNAVPANFQILSGPPPPTPGPVSPLTFPLLTHSSPSLAAFSQPPPHLSAQATTTFQQNTPSPLLPPPSSSGANSVAPLQPPGSQGPPPTADATHPQMDPEAASVISSASPSLQVPPPPPPPPLPSAAPQQQVPLPVYSPQQGSPGQFSTPINQAASAVYQEPIWASFQQRPPPSFHLPPRAPPPPPQPSFPPAYGRPPFTFPSVPPGYRRPPGLLFPPWSPWGPFRPGWPGPRVGGTDGNSKAFTITLVHKRDGEDQPDDCSEMEKSVYCVEVEEVQPRPQPRSVKFIMPKTSCL